MEPRVDGDDSHAGTTTRDDHAHAKLAPSTVREVDADVDCGTSATTGELCCRGSQTDWAAGYCAILIVPVLLV